MEFLVMLGIKPNAGIYLSFRDIESNALEKSRDVPRRVLYQRRAEMCPGEYSIREEQRCVQGSIVLETGDIKW